MSNELAPMQRLFLWSLAVSPGGGLLLKDCRVEVKPAANRKSLVTQGLTTETGRPTYVELTDEGWLWIQEHLREPIDTRSPRVQDVFTGLTQLLASYFACQDQTLSIGQMIHEARKYDQQQSVEMQQPTPVMSDQIPESPTDLVTSFETVSAAIEAACLQLTGGQLKQRVRLSDLRASLLDYSQSDIDETLLAMQQRGSLTMMRLENPAEIHPADRQAALRTASGQENHILYLQGARQCQPQS